MPTLTFEGTVFSGQGRGKCFVALPWVKKQIAEKAGFTPFEGTLNLHLTSEGAAQRQLLKPKSGLQITPQSGYFLGVLFLAEIKKTQAAVVLPIMPRYPADVLEVISPACLRDLFSLKDGEKVALSVTF